MTVGPDNADPRQNQARSSATRVVMALYPAWWRERYEPEQLAFMEDLRDDGRSAVPALASLIGGAVSVRLRPVTMPRTVSAYRDRTRASVAWAMVVAWALLRPIEALQGTYPNDIPAPGRPPAANFPATVALDVSRYAGWAAAGLVLLLLACYVSLLNASKTADERASEEGRPAPRWRLLALTPMILCAIAIVISELHSRLGSYEVLRLVHLAPGASITEPFLMAPHHPLLEAGLAVGTTLASVAFFVLSPIAMAAAFRRVDLDVRDLRFGVAVTRVVAAAAVLNMLAAVAWSYGITQQTPEPSEPSVGMAGRTVAYVGVLSSDASWWPLILLGAIAGCAICVAAANSAHRSLHAAEDIAMSSVAATVSS
jgi:cell division protein FtsL